MLAEVRPITDDDVGLKVLYDAAKDRADVDQASLVE
jgi:hypothetical protein